MSVPADTAVSRVSVASSSSVYGYCDRRLVSSPNALSWLRGEDRARVPEKSPNTTRHYSGRTTVSLLINASFGKAALCINAVMSSKQEFCKVNLTELLEYQHLTGCRYQTVKQPKMVDGTKTSFKLPVVPTDDYCRICSPESGLPSNPWLR